VGRCYARKLAVSASSPQMGWPRAAGELGRQGRSTPRWGRAAPRTRGGRARWGRPHAEGGLCRGSGRGRRTGVGTLRLGRGRAPEAKVGPLRVTHVGVGAAQARGKPSRGEYTTTALGGGAREGCAARRGEDCASLDQAPGRAHRATRVTGKRGWRGRREGRDSP
jgi:hypothetical protein